jgi:hypothetical protein
MATSSTAAGRACRRWGVPVLSVNVDADATYGPAIDWRDPTVLYFTGTRPEAARGKRDLYRVRFRVR